MTEQKPCKTPGCENGVSLSMTDGFCFTCLAALNVDAVMLYKELDVALKRAAEFDLWCLQHGLPDPHDK